MLPYIFFAILKIFYLLGKILKTTVLHFAHSPLYAPRCLPPFAFIFTSLPLTISHFALHFTQYPSMKLSPLIIKETEFNLKNNLGLTLTKIFLNKQYIINEINLNSSDINNKNYPDLTF